MTQHNMGQNVAIPRLELGTPRYGGDARRMVAIDESITISKFRQHVKENRDKTK